MRSRKIMVSAIMSLVMVVNVVGSSITSLAMEQSVQTTQNEDTKENNNLEVENSSGGTTEENNEISKSEETNKKEDVKDDSKEEVLSKEDEEKLINEYVKKVSDLISSESFSYSNILNTLLESNHFYDVLSGLKEEERTSFFNKLTKEEVYQFGLISKYQFVDVMIAYKDKEGTEDAPTKEDIGKLASYVDIYAKVLFLGGTDKNKLEDEKVISEIEKNTFKIIKSNLEIEKLGSETEKSIVDFKTYNEYLQSITTLDIEKILVELSKFTGVSSEDDLLKVTKEFKNFIYSTYGFDDLVEEIVEEDKKEEEKKDEDSNQEYKKDENAKSEEEEKEDLEDGKSDNDRNNLKDDAKVESSKDKNTEVDKEKSSFDENGMVVIKPDSEQENNFKLPNLVGNLVTPSLNKNLSELEWGENKNAFTISGNSGFTLSPYDRLTPRITYLYEGTCLPQYSRSDIWFSGTTENTNNPSSVTLKVAATPAEWNTSDIASAVTYNGGSGSSSRKQSYVAGSIKNYVGSHSGNPSAYIATPVFDSSTSTWSVSYANIDASPSVQLHTYINSKLSNGSWSPVTPEENTWGYFYAQDKIISANMWVDKNSSNTLPSSWSVDNPSSGYRFSSIKVPAKSYVQYLHIAGKSINGKTVSKVIKIPAATYTVKYNGNGATSGSTPSSTHAIGEYGNLTKNGFIRSNYVFDGWNTKADGSGKKYSDGESVINLSTTIGATVNLYAQWSKVGEGIYISSNGSDKNHGRNPENPVATFKRAYEIAKNTGGTIFVVDTVYIRNNTITLSKSYYRDSNSSIYLSSGKTVSIKRYSKPSKTISGFNVKSNLKALISIDDTFEATLILNDIVVDGHKDSVTTGDASVIANGVVSEKPLIAVNKNNYLSISDGAVLRNNKVEATSGSAVEVLDGGEATLFGGLLENNLGGAAAIKNFGYLRISSGTIQNNSDGVYTCDAGIFTMTGGNISNNLNNGISIYNSSSNNISGGSIVNNSGAGVSVTGGGYVSISGVTVSQNDEEGLRLIGGSVRLQGGTISKNANSGVTLSRGSKFTMTAGNIVENESSTDGGGITSLSGRDNTLTVSGGKISNNKSSKNGGGISSSTTNGSMSVSISGGVIKDNVAVGKGDGIYHNVPNSSIHISKKAKIDTSNDVYLGSTNYIEVDSSLESTGYIAKITPYSYSIGRKVVRVDYGSRLASSEYAHSDGSQKFLLTPSNSSISYELRPGDYLDSGARVSNTDIIISRKYNLKYDSNGKEASDMPLTEGVYWYEPTKVSSLIPKAYNFEFESWNTSSFGSGDEYSPSYEIVLFSDKTLYAQWKSIKGTSIYVDGYYGSDSNNGKTPRTAVKTFKQAYTNAKTVGGTIFVVNAVSLYEDVKMSNTSYEDSSGVISLEYGKNVKIKRYSQPNIVTTGFDVASNLEYLITCQRGATLKLQNIIIDGHKSSVVEAEDPNTIAKGVVAKTPVIYINGGSILVIEDGTNIVNNYSTSAGGAITVYNKGELIMNGGTISNNESETNGGGVVNRGVLTLQGGSIVNNKANNGGAIANFVDTLAISGGTISENTATESGGGVYNIDINGKYDPVLIISGGVISKNTANNGGGVYNANNAVVDLNGGAINDNVVNSSGGGIYSMSVINISKGDICNNSAKQGGGIFYANGSVSITGGVVSGNVASKGSGIYNLAKYDLNLSNNAEIDTNNDVFLAGDSYITVNGELSSLGYIAKVTPGSYKNGRKVVMVSYGSKLASDEYAYSDGNLKFLLTPNGNYELRPGNYLDDSANIADTDIIISSKYTLSYDKNNSGYISNMPDNSSSYWYEAFSVSYKIPTSSNNEEFSIWNTNKSGTGDYYIPSSKIILKGNVTLYAQWKSLKTTITFDPNGGTKPDPEKITKDIGDQIGALPITTRVGFAFVGWYTDKDGGTKIEETSLMPETDVTYYAHWDVINPVIEAIKNYYYKDSEVTIADIILNAKANDIVDGDISEDIEIKKIVYPDGTEVLNPSKDDMFNTSTLGEAEVTYMVSTDRGGYDEVTKNVEIIPRKPGGSLSEDGVSAKIYSRYISDETLSDGVSAKDTLDEKSIWRESEYNSVLDESLNKDGDNYLEEHIIKKD